MQTDVSGSETPDIRQKDNLFFRLVIGAIAINLLVYLLAGLSLYNSRMQYDTVASVSTQNIAKNLEANISGIFDKIDISLISVVHEAEKQIATHGIQHDEINKYAAMHHARLPELYGILISDAQGNLLHGTITQPTGKPASVSEREYFQRLRDNPKDELIVTRVLQGRFTGKWSINLVRRINRPDGSFAGVVIGIFELGYFDNLFFQLDIGKRGAIGIRDLDLALVALQPKGKEPGSQIGTKVISQKSRDMIQANPETATYKTVFARDNIERVVTFRKVSRYPFYIFVNRAPSDYLAPWWKETAIVITLLAILTLATFVSARMVLKRNTAELAHAVAQQYGEEMGRKNDELNATLARIKRLEGIISICAYCKKIRTEQQSWEQLETYLLEHSDAMFSHGICPACEEEQMKIIENMK